MNVQDNDQRRLEYQRYLEKSGVIETITKVLAALYELPEKPLDTNEFIRDFLSVSATEDIGNLRKSLTEAGARLNQLDADIELLRKENDRFQSVLDGRVVQRKSTVDGPNAEAAQVAAAVAAAAAAAASSATSPSSPNPDEETIGLHFSVQQQITTSEDATVCLDDSIKETDGSATQPE